MKSIIERLLRSGLAVLATQLIPMAPSLVAFIPPPFNLLAAPVLMGIAKGLRDAYPGKPWIKYVPF